jgi:excisionase family DNA binding protein
MSGPDALITTGEAARHLGISRRTLTRWAKTGALRPALVLPSGRYKWNLDDVRRQIRNMRETDE